MSNPTALLDLDHLSAMTMGDVAVATEVLEIFKGQAATWGQMLDSSAPRTHWADAAHTLKGAALGIGARPLAEICGRAEALGRGDEDVSEAAAAVMLNDVRGALAQTLEAVHAAAHTIGLKATFHAA